VTATLDEWSSLPLRGEQNSAYRSTPALFHCSKFLNQFHIFSMSSFYNPGKILIVIGICLVAVGLLFLLVDKIPFLGRLPGDIFLKKDNFSFFFPLTTCLIISVLLSLLFYLFRK